MSGFKLLSPVYGVLTAVFFGSKASQIRLAQFDLGHHEPAIVFQLAMLH
jgi:hypothetical protein